MSTIEEPATAHTPAHTPAPTAPPKTKISATILDPLRTHFLRGYPGWVSTAPGWWPLIAELDRVLSAIEPNYRVAQVKEKYGTLRFYLESAAHDEYSCCLSSESWTEEEFDNHTSSPAHQEEVARDANRRATAKSRHETLELVVDRYEQLSALICEQCGLPGATEVHQGWWKTVCPTHSSKTSPQKEETS